MKKRLNRAMLKSRAAHIAYDKQFKQQREQALERKEQPTKENTSAT